MSEADSKANFEFSKYYDDLREVEQSTAFFLHAALAMFESEDSFDADTLLGMRQHARSVKQKFNISKEQFFSLQNNLTSQK